MHVFTGNFFNEEHKDEYTSKIKTGLFDYTI